MIPLTVTAADLSRSAPPRWAWQDRFVLGYLNLLVGNEGVGKGTFIAWAIARWTRGELPGDLHGQPVNVGILGDEDSFDDVWTPRLYAAGADLGRVFQIERPDGGYVDLRRDRAALDAAVAEHQLAVLFFDQLLDNLGAGTDDWRQKAVRDALQPIRAIARAHDVLALGSLHPNKRAESFRQLIAGAAAFNAVSRSSMLLAAHPDDETRRVLCRGKGNLSREPESIEFRIDEHHFAANGREFKVPLAAGFTVGTFTVDDLIGNEGAREEHSRIADACEIIEALLPKDGQWHEAKPLKEACAEDGIDDRTVKRAKNRLSIEHRRSAVFHAGTEWRWPHSQDAVGTSARSVPTVPSVPSGNRPNPSISSSWATGDTEDSENASPECAPSGSSGREPDKNGTRGKDDAAGIGSSKRNEEARRWAATHREVFKHVKGGEA